ncbi:hypothetical protein BC628DRAFT_1363525 [Trametes gibbosa]|nr:hypothetical protein BC628DRAFT_1363525 [Trametes gibbosa]
MRCQRRLAAPFAQASAVAGGGGDGKPGRDVGWLRARRWPAAVSPRLVHGHARVCAPRAESRVGVVLSQLSAQGRGAAIMSTVHCPERRCQYGHSWRVARGSAESNLERGVGGVGGGAGSDLLAARMAGLIERSPAPPVPERSLAMSRTTDRTVLAVFSVV